MFQKGNEGMYDDYRITNYWYFWGAKVKAQLT